MKKEEMPYVGITKKTPVADALKYGKCDKGRDCNDCSKLCQFGSGALADEDFKPLARHLSVSVEKLKQDYLEEIEKFGTKRYRPRLQRQKATPYGRCIFYNDQEKCTVHGVKPLECKVATCNDHGPQLIEWFTLNYYVDPSKPDSIRDWAAKLRTHPTIPGGELHELVPDRQLLKKILSYEVLR